MASDLTLRLPNTFDALTSAAEQTEAFLESNSASPETIFAANLAIEELVTNIIKYGYDDTDAHEIVVHLFLKDGELHIEITDDGHEFNPFDQPPPDTSLPVEDMPIGGLGIHFVRNMLDSCAYHRNGGQNIVSLSKKLS